MKFKWSKESIALQPSDCKAEQNENVILNQRLVDIFEAHHYCSTTKCWIVVDDLEGYACFVAHIDPECPGDTDDEYFAEGLDGRRTRVAGNILKNANSLFVYK